MRTAASRQGYPHRKIIKQQWNNASPVFEEIVCRFSSHSHVGWCPYEDRLSRLSGSGSRIELQNILGCMQIGWGHFPSTAHLPGHGVSAGNFPPYASRVVAAPARCPFSHFLRRLHEMPPFALWVVNATGLLFRRCWQIQLKRPQAFFGRSLTESAVGNTTTPS